MIITFQVRHDIDAYNPTGKTMSGEMVDVGLPEGETAALCHAGFNGWAIRHVESGLTIGGALHGSPAEAIREAREGNLLRKDTLKRMCRDARYAMDVYRGDLWLAAARAENGPPL